MKISILLMVCDPDTTLPLFSTLWLVQWRQYWKVTACVTYMTMCSSHCLLCPKSRGVCSVFWVVPLFFLILYPLYSSPHQAERRFQSRLQDLKDRLEQSESTNRSMQNYVHFLKSSYTNVFGEAALSSSPIRPRTPL